MIASILISPVLRKCLLKKIYNEESILPSYLTGGSTLSVYLHISRYFTNSAPYRLLTLATSQAKVYRFTLQ